MVFMLNCKNRLTCLGLVCDGVHAELQEQINYPRGQGGGLVLSMTMTTAW